MTARATPTRTASRRNGTASAARRPKPRDEGRAAVIRQAASAIASRGYHGMSMRDLAKVTKRSLASFYHLFNSKEEILFELQRGAFESLIEAARAAVDAASDPSARLEAFVDNHVRFFVAQPDVMHVLVVEASALPPAQRAIIRKLKQRYFKLGESVLVELAARPGTEPDAVALERATYCMFGMLNWIYGWYEPERHGPPAALAKTIADCTEHGVAAAIHGGGRRS
jgi:AcrR family transcriptional regulator